MPPKTSGWRGRFAEAWAAFDARKGGRTTARVFAAALEWPESTLSEINSSDESPTHSRILQLAAVTGLNPGYLAYSVGPKVLEKEPAAEEPPDMPVSVRPARPSKPVHPTGKGAKKTRRKGSR